MTTLLVANLLRSVVSNVMNLILIFTMARPKYGRKAMILVAAAVILLDLSMASYFYTRGAYTDLAKFDFLKLLALWILLKPLFRDSFMQWSFTFLTDLNIFIVIVVFSYRLRVFFPYPMFAHTLLRFGFFLLIIWVFQRYLRPYYRQAVEHWNIAFFLAATILLNFGYYIFADGGLIENMDNRLTPLLLLIALGITVYAAIFLLLRKISEENALQEVNLVADLQHKNLKNELLLYKDLIDDTRQSRHDLHHHNMILSEYLGADDLSGARRYLKQYDDSIANAALPMYCENLTANVLLRVFHRRASESGVHFETVAQIPEELSLPDPELGTLLGNLMENALEACSKCGAEDRILALKIQVVSHSLEIELRNSLCGSVIFDDDLPRSTKKGGGTGTRSIQHIVERHGGMLRFRQEGQTFVTQILMPV